MQDLTPASTTSYSYDGDGRRLSSSTSGGTDLRFSWDPLASSGIPELALERDSSGNLVRRYLDGPLGAVSLTNPSATFYYQHDPLGAVTDVTDASGGAQWKYEYEAYGAEHSATNVSGSAPANPLRFEGQYLDSETALYHLRARQYDPAIGRFDSVDPIENAPAVSSVGTYVYVDGRPTVGVDPLGLWCPGCDWVEDKAGDVGGWATDKAGDTGGWAAGKAGDAAGWVEDKGAATKDAVVQSQYWDIRSHSEFWKGQERAGAENSNPVLGFFQWGAGKAAGGLLQNSGLETVQGSAETMADPCANTAAKVEAGASIVGVAVGWLGAGQLYKWYRMGEEFWITQDVRVAPFGNRGPGRFHLPHYHRAKLGTERGTSLGPRV